MTSSVLALDGSRERGLGLVEAILSLGLLAGVLVSVAALFVLGGRQIESGRAASEALSVARDAMEEIEGWGFRQIYSHFGFDGSAAAYTVDSRSNPHASRWQQALDRTLVRSHATVEIRSLSSSGVPPPLATTRAIRVVVTVRWEEGERPRSLRLGTVRF